MLMGMFDIWRADEDSPDVLAPPPAIYGLGFLVGYALDVWWGWSFGVGEATGIGLVPIVGGFALALWCFVHFRRAGTAVPTNKTTTALVTDGPYQVTRNPIYAALTAVYLGLCAIVDAPAALLGLVAVLPLMHYGVVLREERYLEAEFGDEYVAFAARTKRYV